MSNNHMKALDFLKRGVPIVGRPFFIANKYYCGKILNISSEGVDLLAVRNDDKKKDSFLTATVGYESFYQTTIDVLKRSSNKSILYKLNRIEECIKIEKYACIGDLYMVDIGKYGIYIDCGNTIIIDAKDYAISLTNKYCGSYRMHIIGEIKYEILYNAIYSYPKRVNSKIKDIHEFYDECYHAYDATRHDNLYKIIDYIYRNECYESISANRKT